MSEKVNSRAKNDSVLQDLLKRVFSVHFRGFRVIFKNLLNPVKNFGLLFCIRVFLKRCLQTSIVHLQQNNKLYLPRFTKKGKKTFVIVGHPEHFYIPIHVLWIYAITRKCFWAKWKLSYFSNSGTTVHANTSWRETLSASSFPGFSDFAFGLYLSEYANTCTNNTLNGSRGGCSSWKYKYAKIYDCENMPDFFRYIHVHVWTEAFKIYTFSEIYM